MTCMQCHTFHIRSYKNRLVLVYDYYRMSCITKPNSAEGLLCWHLYANTYFLRAHTKPSDLNARDEQAARGPLFKVCATVISATSVLHAMSANTATLHCPRLARQPADDHALPGLRDAPLRAGLLGASRFQSARCLECALLDMFRYTHPPLHR